MHVISRQPWKSLYVLYHVASTTTLRLPVWVLLCLVSRRPRQSWSIWRTVLVQLVRHYIRVTEAAGQLLGEPNHRALVPNSGGVWVETPSPSLVNVDLQALSAASQARFVRLPGYWTPALEGGDVEGKILYSLHGGSYISGSAHPSAPSGSITNSILASCPAITHVFAIEYRLSSSTEHAFPTALLDAISGYHYLVNSLHIPPENIIIEGDSAGGNLALALIRYIVQSGLLPTPSASILLSPWADIAPPMTQRFPSYPPLRSSYTPTTIRSLMGLTNQRAPTLDQMGWGIAELNPYISPGSRNAVFDTISFAGFPPTFISAGGAENLLPQIRLLAERMKRDLGEEARFHEAEDACHDFLLFSWQEPQRTDMLDAISLWVQSLD